MIRFRISLINLLGLYLILSEDHSGCSFDTGEFVLFKFSHLLTVCPVTLHMLCSSLAAVKAEHQSSAGYQRQAKPLGELAGKPQLSG